MNKKNTQKGFSVLFASLVGSLVLAIGLAILSITIKQITLSSAGRESQKAFYAADTGTEFALFLDRGGDNTEDCPDGIFPLPGSTSICDVSNHSYMFDGVILNINGGINGPSATMGIDSDGVDVNGFEYTTTVIRVERTYIQNNPICFDVYITKRSNDSNVTVSTEIESRGYSTCNVSAANRFERAIRTLY